MPEQGHCVDSRLTVLKGGIQRRHPAENFPDNDWEEVLQVNLNTVFTITRDAGKHMLESRGGVAGQAAPSGASNPRGNGKIINISSLVAFQGGLNVPAYAAAKHGVQGLVCSSLASMLYQLIDVDQGILERLGGQGCQCQCHCSWLHLDRRGSLALDCSETLMW